MIEEAWNESGLGKAGSSAAQRWARISLVCAGLAAIFGAAAAQVAGGSLLGKALAFAAAVVAAVTPGIAHSRAAQ
jgi:hypothetical protein